MASAGHTQDATESEGAHRIRLGGGEVIPRTEAANVSLTGSPEEEDAAW